MLVVDSVETGSENGNPQYSPTESARRVTAMRNAVKRNFILQQGFEDPAPAVCQLQYSALLFQPRIVFIWLVAGILFQSPAVFAALCAVLWWNALLPKLNLFDALYNRTIGSRPGVFRFGPAPAPRRAAQTMAGGFALTSALLIHAGFSLAAYVVEAIFLAAVLALTIGGFCLGSFVYHLFRGHWRFACQTLPWASWSSSLVVVGYCLTLLAGVAYGQAHMMQDFQALFSPFFGSKSTPPVPFGFKTGWLAVRSTDLKAVVESLPFRFQTAAGWQDGIEAAYKGGSVFITPPVNGWICIVGEWVGGTGERSSVESIAKTVSELSSRFGEAHGYATHRVIEYHHWIMAKQGRVVRCFAYIGESGEVLCQSGSLTDAERKLRYASLPPDQWLPDEQDVMTVASGWSFDPSRLSSASGPAARGRLARLK
jgi:Domain of unknown function (DUF4395)